MEGVFGDPVKRYNLAMEGNIEFHIKVSYLEIFYGENPGFTRRYVWYNLLI